jgi:hypothetical protein
MSLEPRSTAAWLLLVASLPTRPSAARMRLWRALKGMGCASLRDGVWLIPDGGGATHQLDRLAGETLEAGGQALVLRVSARDEAQERSFRALFDRGEDYARLLATIDDRAREGGVDTKSLRVLRRELADIAVIDFFPGEARRQAEGALAALEARLSGEPQAASGSIMRLRADKYRGRLWATRKHLWVDRLASAWLIHRFIDTDARFLWLEQPGDCPKRALGFDFDGATFCHVGHRVTFETLLASFGLDGDAALARLGALVHYLDVGGAPMAEAAGVEAVLAGISHDDRIDDDALLAAAMPIFDGLYRNFTAGAAQGGQEKP